MAFTAASVNYASQYLAALEQAFPYVLHFGALRSSENNGRFRWINSKTIEIPQLSTSGRVTANRDTIAAAGRKWNNSWVTKTLTNERYWKTLVHPRDIDQTNMVASIGNITKVYNEEQKFPEMDAYLVSKAYADWTGFGKAALAQEITVANVLSTFDALMEKMTEARVPEAGRILYIIPAVNTLLKQAEGLSRTLNVGQTANAVYRSIGNLDRVSIEVVPSNLMKTVYNFTEGWATGASAKQIQMLLIHPSCILTPISYDFAQLAEPSAVTDGKYVYYEESHEDVFLLENKADACEFVIEADTAGN